MKINFFTLGIVALLFASCQKKMESVVKDAPLAALAGQTPVKQFTKYTIPTGEQYCQQNTYQHVSYQEMKFTVRFDSSAIYQTTNPHNQTDINKLYGFSDNNGFHHDFSARFGWRWSNNALRLFGYIYNNGVMSCKEIGSVDIGTEYNCSIKVTDSTYIFGLNTTLLILPRASKTSRGEGYKLFPYFGGDEMAPHPIAIWIKE